MIRDPKKDEMYLQIIELQGTLEGRFTKLRRVNSVGGSGSFSLVCIAHDLQTGTDVALKFFYPDAFTPQFTYRWDSFERESRILAQLQGSRDIIGIVSPQAQFEYIPNPQLPVLKMSFSYYVMEKADESLEDIIAGNAWTPREMLLALRTITRGLQRIHSRQISHRDLKPGNCLITASGLKLSDFGTARTVSESPLLGQYMGPPGDMRFVAPEMMSCLHDVEARYAFSGDFFALGAILFEVVTGQNLGVRLFDKSYLRDLTPVMSKINRADREKIFHQVIGPIAHRYQLPILESINPSIPGCIRPQLNQLFRELCALDYRKRNTSFPSIFRYLDTCILILDNEAKYNAWLTEKRRRRAIHAAKKNGVAQ